MKYWGSFYAKINLKYLNIFKEVCVMDRNTFKIIHSELIQQVQSIEFNLRRTYAAMCSGDFNENFKRLEKSNLGKIAHELEDLDYSDDCPELTEEEYDLIDDIREIRNYWCHQCYLDFIYIKNNREREEQFQRVARRLQQDENRTYALSVKSEKIFFYIWDKFRE